MKVVRTRNYGTIIYPESAGDFEERIREAKVPAILSPLHNRDVNKDTGELKKEHYHLLIMFDGVKTREQAEELISEIGGVGCEVVKSVTGYARYLCHLDEKEKYKYSIGDVKEFFGADYVSLIKNKSDRYEAIAEIIEYCEKNEIIAFFEIVNYARKEKPEWFRVLCDSGAYIVEKYLKSFGWMKGRNGYY